MPNPDLNRIFGFWTGDNPMPETRQRCFESFSLTGLEPVLVTPETLKDWVVPDHPLHPAYELLSPVHRSDYLRPYFMYHYGGGYSDIKTQTGSWRKAIQKVLNSSRLWGAGYREIKGGTVWLQNNKVNGTAYILSKPVPDLAAKFVTDAMRGFYPQMIGNCAFFFKPQTKYAQRWLKEAERRLDILLPDLRNHPPAHPRDRLGGMRDHEHNGYPIPWSFIMGDINGPLSLLYRRRLSRDLPAPQFHGYL